MLPKLKTLFHPASCHPQWYFLSNFRKRGEKSSFMDTSILTLNSRKCKCFRWKNRKKVKNFKSFSKSQAVRLTHDFLNFPEFLKVFIFTVFLWGNFHFFEEVLRNFSFRAGQTKKILLLYLNKSKKKSKFKPVHF